MLAHAPQEKLQRAVQFDILQEHESKCLWIQFCVIRLVIKTSSWKQGTLLLADSSDKEEARRFRPDCPVGSQDFGESQILTQWKEAPCRIGVVHMRLESRRCDFKLGTVTVKMDTDIARRCNAIYYSRNATGNNNWSIGGD